MRRTLLRYKDQGGSYDFGNALNFNASLSMKVVSNASTNTNQHTFSFWLKPNAISTVLPGCVLAKQNVTNRYLVVRDGYVRQKWGAGTVTHSIPAMNTSDYFHFFGTRDGTNYRLWFNGVESISGTIVNVSTSDGYNMFGANHNSEYLDGVLDDLYYFKNIVGTEQNAQDIYNNGFGADPSVVMGSNGFYYFDFNTETGNQSPINKGSASGATAINFPATGNYILH